MTDSDLVIWYGHWGFGVARRTVFLMTTAWALPLVRRRAVDHGRMRSSLCRP